MPSTAGRILVAGHISPTSFLTIKALERVGCGFHFVNTIAEAEEALGARRFDIVLAGEITSDGRGYDLTDSVVNRSATLLVAITLSEACLWLPVVQHGVRTLGDRALNSHALPAEITALLNEKSTPPKAPPDRAVGAFIPERSPHRPIAGPDRLPGPEERSGAYGTVAPESKKLMRHRSKGGAGSTRGRSRLDAAEAG